MHLFFIDKVVKTTIMTSIGIWENRNFTEVMKRKILVPETPQWLEPLAESTAVSPHS